MSGRVGDAETDFEKAIALRPDAGWVEGTIAAIYFRNQRPDIALPRIESALARIGEDPSLLALKGQVLLGLRRLNEAENCLRRCLSRSPDEHAVVFNLAEICCETGRYDEAIRLLRSLLGIWNLKVDRLKVVAMIDHANRRLSRRFEGGSKKLRPVGPHYSVG